MIKDSGFTKAISFAEANNVSKKLSRPFSAGWVPPANLIFACGLRKDDNKMRTSTQNLIRLWNDVGNDQCIRLVEGCPELLFRTWVRSQRFLGGAHFCLDMQS